MGLHSQSRMASVADAVGQHLSVHLMFTGEGKGSPFSSPNPRDLKKGRKGKKKEKYSLTFGLTQSYFLEM